MSINDFLSKSNIEMIWDVIMDEDIFKNRTKETIININNLFNKLIKEFFDSEKNKYNNLIDMNKQFIKIILNYINRLFPLRQNSQNIPNAQNKQLITSEDIQQNRMTQFEKDLTIKQQEFTNAITLPVPPTPNFSDKLDEPISEMGLAVKQMMAQRKYDTEIFNQQLNKNDSNWLQSQETSIKNDKLNKPIENKPIENKNNININKNEKNDIDILNNNYKVKYIKIDNKDIIDFTIEKEVIDLNKKQLSWSDNNITIEFNELDTVTNYNVNNNISNKTNNDFNILSKLKMIPNNNHNNNNNNNNNITNENNDKKIDNLENKVNDLSSKLDSLIELMKAKNIL